VKVCYAKDRLKKKALEDIREEFIFVVLDSLLKNLIEGKKLIKDCACCTNEEEYKINLNNPVDLIYINHIHLLKFLEEKYEISQEPVEYDLLWRYNLIKKNRKKASEILIDIAKRKFIDLKTRINYISKSYCIIKSDETKTLLEIAQIQQEYSEKQPETLDLKSKLLDSDTLFNDYLLLDDEYLALKMMKICENNDSDTKKELIERLFSGDYYQIIEKLGYCRDLNEDQWIEIETIGDVLIHQLESESKMNLIRVLINFNYDEKKVRKFIEERIKGNVFMHPEIKKRLVLEVKDYFGENQNYYEIKNYFLKHFGFKKKKLK